MRELLAIAAVDRHVSLTSSATIASPVALAGDEICLPRRALVELEAAEQESMLAHEIAHIVRRDPQWLIAARAIEVVLFFQPLNRLARRRMQEVAEYLCDDWAVARTSRPVTLAKCLAAVAEWVSRAPRVGTPALGALSAMVESGGSPLVRRVGRILSRQRAPHRRTSRIAVASATMTLVAMAAIAPRVSIAHPSPSALALLRTRGDVRGATVRENMLVRRIVVAGAGVVDMRETERHLRAVLVPAYDSAYDLRQRH
jgi:beta-lactamase regulating signal transducer with metallopeptidase domain